MKKYIISPSSFVKGYDKKEEIFNYVILPYLIFAGKSSARSPAGNGKATKAAESCHRNCSRTQVSKAVTETVAEHK